MLLVGAQKVLAQLLSKMKGGWTHHVLTGRWSCSWIHLIVWCCQVQWKSSANLWSTLSVCKMLATDPRWGTCTVCSSYAFSWLPVSTFVQEEVRTCYNFFQLIPEVRLSFPSWDRLLFLGLPALSLSLFRKTGLTQVPNQPCLLFGKRMPGIKVIPAHLMSICEPQKQNPAVLEKD